ncbi:predicted protein [Sparassis crispa]|uniref:DUF7702 domain-containing protein n=1 Tax=Sparassis crispa TaxID=139825 RepID=A0A401G8H8_9APHY|nr:predicted protein [Sparassis crispa]GBE78458.1 predicted protein [Sparassis crispa]
MALDKRGDVAAAEIVIYIPILVISFILVVRHGFARTAGWIFLVILSIIRIVGGVTHVLSETSDKNNSTLITIYSIMESAGLSPLLMATLGFCNTVAQNSVDSHPLMSRGTHLMGLLGTLALVLSIIGGVKMGVAKTESDLHSASTLRHVGSILFLVLFVATFFVHVFLWNNRGRILKYRRQLLAGISAALPFLFIRVLYSVLGSFAPLSESIDANGKVTHTTNNSFLSNFSITGSWVIYVVMSVLMEYIAILIYVIVGIKTPLQNDYLQSPLAERWDEDSAESAKLQPYAMQQPYAQSQPSYAQGQGYAAPYE